MLGSIIGNITASPQGRRPKGAVDPRVWVGVAVFLVVLIMLGHYWTDPRWIGLHNIYRRLCYIPIVLAAFAYGPKGGLTTAAAASIAYFPHAFLSHHHRDPSPTEDKLSEMVLYFLIGGLTGWLVRRRQQAHAALEQSLAERDLLETELVRAGKMSALGELAAGLAHEIRNPLASIMGSAEALMSDYDESHRKYRIGKLMLKEIDRLNRVVSDILGFARPNPPERSVQDLTALAKEVVEVTQSEARSRQVAVSVSDQQTEAIAIDRDQIIQVLLNLLLNALQAFDNLPDSDNRQRSVRVEFGDEEVAGEQFFGVGVLDNGPGITGDDPERIFDPYYSTRGDGTGLGLTVSNRIVEAHDGFMRVERETDKTGVWFYLPKGEAKGDNRGRQ